MDWTSSTEARNQVSIVICKGYPKINEKNSDEINRINENFIHFYVTSLMNQSKHTVSNELPYNISGHHRLPVASLIPAKIHTLQTIGDTHVY